MALPTHRSPAKQRQQDRPNTEHLAGIIDVLTDVAAVQFVGAPFDATEPVEGWL